MNRKNDSIDSPIAVFVLIVVIALIFTFVVDFSSNTINQNRPMVPFEKIPIMMNFK